MYKIIKDGDTEVARVLADFLEAPEESVQSYISDFKLSISEMLSSIPEVKYADSDTTKKLTALVRLAAYLESCIPARSSLENQQVDTE
jgi:hypothetical protein